MGLLDDELEKWKRALGLLSTLQPSKDSGVRGLLDMPSKVDDSLYSKSGIYKGIKDAVTAPVRAYRGEIDPWSSDGVQEALNVAGIVPLSGVAGMAAGVAPKGHGEIGRAHV